MKTLKLITIGMVIFLAGTVQVKAEVDVNIYAPPLCGPVIYPEVRYYSLPGVEAYYDMQTSMLIYYGAGMLEPGIYFSPNYESYFFYNGYNAMINYYGGWTPYSYYDLYRMKYNRGHGERWQDNFYGRPCKGYNRGQMPFRESPNKMGNQGNHMKNYNGPRNNGGNGNNMKMNNGPKNNGIKGNNMKMNNGPKNNSGNINSMKMNNGPKNNGMKGNNMKMNNGPKNNGGNGNKINHH